MKIKKILLIFTFCLFNFSFFSQNLLNDSDLSNAVDDISDNLLQDNKNDSEEDEEKDNDENKIKATKGGLSVVPAKKRPRPIDKKKAADAAEKDEDKNTVKDNINTIKYGIPSEISDLVDKLIENDDPRFTEEIYDVFQTTKSPVIKAKILNYFTKLEDPCLENFAVDLLNDPYDEKADVVKAAFKYISAVKTKEAIPAVVNLIETENETYFADAIETIGDIGGPAEAMFLVEYLERDDLGDAKRQILMKTCGKMHAVETWDKLVEVLKDEDENTYVRMYAAESLGLMEKPESVEILIQMFNEPDPNLRQYVIKGLSHFPNDEDAKATIIQGIRDEHWRVRQESINAAKEMKLEESVPFLIYRAKNDSENVIKKDSYKAIGAINTSEGNDFLINQLKDKKVGDGTKKIVVEVLLEEGNAGEKEVLELAEECLKDDRRKDLRYGIGKVLAKHSKSAYEKICLMYLQSKDATTIGLGLDMYKNHKFSSAESVMRDIVKDKKANSGIKNRIKTMLNIEDDLEESQSQKSSKNGNSVEVSEK